MFHHDCVIVPGLGGFVTNSQPARIHPVQHQFYPPSKSIGFNIHLKRNDGLLANTISQVEIVNYEEALQIITDYVNSCHINLKENNNYIIEKVGRLYFDVEKHLRFEADTSQNYLLDSFGLTTIQSPPIKRETLTEKVEKQVKYRAPVKPEHVGEKKKFPWKTALVLPVIGIFVWASIQTINVYQHKSDTGNLNPFNTSDTKIPAKVEKPGVIIIPEAEQNVTNDNFSIESDTNAITVDDNSDPAEETIINTEVDEPVEITAPTYKKYFVVAGAFAVPGNADKLILQLKSKGFHNAAIIDTTRQGLHVVSYNEGFESYAEAVQNLNTLKSEENNAAWLLKK